MSRETKGSEAYVKRFDGYQHLVVMLFGILKHFDSLRELEIGMKVEAHKLGHLGMNYLVRLSTHAEANIRRPQEFFARVYAYLLEKYAKFLAGQSPILRDFGEGFYALWSFNGQQLLPIIHSNNQYGKQQERKSLDIDTRRFESILKGNDLLEVI